MAFEQTSNAFTGTASLGDVGLPWKSGEDEEKKVEDTKTGENLDVGLPCQSEEEEIKVEYTRAGGNQDVDPFKSEEDEEKKFDNKTGGNLAFQNSIAFTKEEWLDAKVKPGKIEEDDKKPETVVQEETKSERALEQTGNSLHKEEWLDDVKIPCKSEEEQKAGVGILENNRGLVENVVSRFSMPQQVFSTADPVSLEASAHDSMNNVVTSSHGLMSHSHEIKTENLNEMSDPPRVVLRPELFSCGICSYGTSRRDQLQNHMAKHSEELCPSTASIADPRVLGLKCRLCDYVAAAASDLIKHRLESHNTMLDHPMKCGLCDFKGYSEEIVELHNLEKHKLKVCCQYCSYACVDKPTLKKHMEGFHKALPHAVLKLKLSAGFRKVPARRGSVPYDPDLLPCALCAHQADSNFDFVNHMTRAHKVPESYVKIPTKKSRKSVYSNPPMLTGNGLLD